VKTALSIILISALALKAAAGDYFPYRAKRLTYEFAVPFDSPNAPKLPTAKLTVTTQPDAEGRYPFGIGVAPLASIEVELGKQLLSVPKQLLSELGPLDLDSLDFYWVGGRYYVALSRKASDPAAQPERVEFVFRDGLLVDFWLARKSLRDKHPKLFQGTTPHPPAPTTDANLSKPMKATRQPSE
jgi:hypothetical protein